MVLWRRNGALYETVKDRVKKELQTGDGTVLCFRHPVMETAVDRCRIEALAEYTAYDPQFLVDAVRYDAWKALEAWEKRAAEKARERRQDDFLRQNDGKLEPQMVSTFWSLAPGGVVYEQELKRISREVFEFLDSTHSATDAALRHYDDKEELKRCASWLNEPQSSDEESK